MTAFRPGDLAVITGDTAGLLHRFEPGAIVEIGHRYNDADIYACTRHGMAYGVDGADLRLLYPPAPAPTPSPLAALAESANTFLRAVLDNRVSVEQTWRTPQRTTYRFVVEPEEKS